MDGEGFANKCSGICTATHEIATGDQQYIEVTAYPNHTGVFRLEGRVEFVYDGETESQFVTQDVRVNVHAGSGGNENRSQPLPTSPPQPTAPAAPAAPVAPAPQQQSAPAAQPTPQVIVVTQAPAQAQAPAGGGGQAPQQPQPAVGVTGTGGCLAPDPNDAGVVDPTLLLAGLLLPAGILARWGISRRRR